GSFFTRGTTRDAHARYSEKGPDYLYNVHRLMKKWDTARGLVPQPIEHRAAQPTRIGAIHFGSTSPAMAEAVGVLQEQRLALDTLRLRAFPFPDSVAEFIRSHEVVCVVEQNRDAQLRTLLINEFDIDPARLVPILHYDGTPITARFIAMESGAKLRALHVVALEKERVA